MGEAVKRISKKAQEKNEYSQMYNEAKQIMVGGDMEEFDMFFDAVKGQFDDVTERYDYAVQHKKADVNQLKAEHETMQQAYKAAMNVKFDLEEKKKEEEAEMEVEVPEDQELEIKTTIDYLVKTKAKDEITTMLQTAYDKMTEATIKHEKQPDDEATTV